MRENTPGDPPGTVNILAAIAAAERAGEKPAKHLNAAFKAAAREAREAKRAEKKRRRQARRSWRAWRREQWLAAAAPTTRLGLLGWQAVTVVSVLSCMGVAYLLTGQNKALPALALLVAFFAIAGLVVLSSALADRGRRNLSAWRHWPPRMTPPHTDV